MNKNIILTIMFGILLISLASATDYLPHKIGEDFDLTVSSNNATQCNLTYLQYPNGTNTIQNIILTQSGTSFYTTVNQNNYTSSGITCQGISCTDGNTLQTGSVCRDVTSTGFSLTEGSSTIYLGLIGLIIFLFLIVFYGIGLLPSSQTKIEDGLVSINYLKYFRSVLWFVEWILLVALFFLASNLSYAYLGETLFADFLFAIYYITMALTPVILVVWFIGFFITIAKDKKLKALMNRGFMGGTA